MVQGRRHSHFQAIGAGVLELVVHRPVGQGGVAVLVRRVDVTAFWGVFEAGIDGD